MTMGLQCLSEAGRRSVGSSAKNPQLIPVRDGRFRVSADVYGQGAIITNCLDWSSSMGLVVDIIDNGEIPEEWEGLKMPQYQEVPLVPGSWGEFRLINAGEFGHVLLDLDDDVIWLFHQRDPSFREIHKLWLMAEDLIPGRGWTIGGKWALEGVDEILEKWTPKQAVSSLDTVA